VPVPERARLRAPNGFGQTEKDGAAPASNPLIGNTPKPEIHSPADFYDRICNGSPCENHSTFQIRLYDSDGNYIPNAPCKVTIEQREPYQMQANAQGVIVLRDVKPQAIA